MNAKPKRLTVIDIGTPCSLDWGSMKPTDGGRFCGECKKVVRDLSSLAETDARTLLESSVPGAMCARYLYDEHGRVFFQGVPSQAFVAPSRLVRARRAAASLAAAAIPLATAGCQVYENTGDIAATYQEVPGAVEGDDGGSASLDSASDAQARADAATSSSDGGATPDDAAVAPVAPDATAPAADAAAVGDSAAPVAPDSGSPF